LDLTICALNFPGVGLDDIGIKRVGAQNMIVSPNRVGRPQ
jgi:hypothetical protein